MTKSLHFLLLLVCFSASAQKANPYLTVFEKGNGNQTATYLETIAFYTNLAKDFPTLKMQQMGVTDSGEPLHIVTFNPDKNFDFDALQKTKAVILINNGIHPGEPDGIDATMRFFRDLATGKIKAPVNTVLVAIPIYNIGGALNRNANSRANQDGPESYGFRGNARNFDLNRDFIKSDTRNTKSFVGIFHLTNPEIFIDNHVSNGADYQYVLTYIMTQHNKLGGHLGSYLNEVMMPEIVANLKKKKIESTPYVNAWGTTPDKGFTQFFESPRYATGYTSLFNTIGFVVETHMLKKYAARVQATYEFMLATMEYTDKHYKKIKENRAYNERNYQPGFNYPIEWKIDSTEVETMAFLGYESSIKKSEATTGNRLFYDRNKPYSKNIPFYKTYKSVKEVTIPAAYIIPKGQWQVLDLLRANRIKTIQLKKDTLIEVESYRITDYKTANSAYEGHYLHRNTTVASQIEKVPFYKGDHLISTRQKGVKYLLETLEPEAVDSFFNWNFFDAILQQKEHYSDYVFEDLAVQLLKENPQLKSQFEEKLKSDKVFAAKPEAQLNWIYINSVYYEKSHLQYPVYRILK